MPRWVVRLCVGVTTVALAGGWAAAADCWPKTLNRCREQSPSAFFFVENGRPVADVVLLADSELTRNAVEWLQDFVQRETKTAHSLSAAASAPAIIRAI